MILNCVFIDHLIVAVVRPSLIFLCLRFTVAVRVSKVFNGGNFKFYFYLYKLCSTFEDRSQSTCLLEFQWLNSFSLIPRTDLGIASADILHLQTFDVSLRAVTSSFALIGLLIEFHWTNSFSQILLPRTNLGIASGDILYL